MLRLLFVPQDFLNAPFVPLATNLVAPDVLIFCDALCLLVTFKVNSSVNLPIATDKVYTSFFKQASFYFLPSTKEHFLSKHNF